MVGRVDAVTVNVFLGPDQDQLTACRGRQGRERQTALDPAFGRNIAPPTVPGPCAHFRLSRHLLGCRQTAAVCGVSEVAGKVVVGSGIVRSHD